MDVNNDIQLSNKVPDIILLLSLCYWIKRCQKLIDSDNFNIKFSELKDSFQTGLVIPDLQQIPEIVNILKDTSLITETRKK